MAHNINIGDILMPKHDVWLTLTQNKTYKVLAVTPEGWYEICNNFGRIFLVWKRQIPDQFIHINSKLGKLLYE
jgi:hypothetical protein